MNIKRIYEHNILDEMLTHIGDGKEELLYYVADKVTIFPGYGTRYEEKIPNTITVHLPNQGGIIVSGIGSISVGHISKDINNDFNVRLTQKIVEFLKSKNLKVSLDGNDILVDDKYKLASSGTRRFGDVLLSTFHISQTVDLDLIKYVCSKPMNKIPKGFNEYGVTSEELLNFVNKSFEEILNEMK